MEKYLVALFTLPNVALPLLFTYLSLQVIALCLSMKPSRSHLMLDVTSNDLPLGLLHFSFTQTWLIVFELIKNSLLYRSE